jgi:hypothetical protein
MAQPRDVALLPVRQSAIYNLKCERLVTRGRSAALTLTKLILTLMISRLIYPVGRNGGLAADVM